MAPPFDHPRWHRGSEEKEEKDGRRAGARFLIFSKRGSSRRVAAHIKQLGGGLQSMIQNLLLEGVRGGSIGSKSCGICMCVWWVGRDGCGIATDGCKCETARIPVVVLIWCGTRSCWLVMSLRACCLCWQAVVYLVASLAVVPRQQV